MKKFDIFIILIDLILVSLMYYLMLPPINLTSIDFWSFICMIGIIIFITINFFIISITVSAITI